MKVILPPPWTIPESQVAPESAWINRRALMKALGAGAAASLLSCRADAREPRSPVPNRFEYELPEVARNPRWPGGRPPAVEITPEEYAASYNNFYEFTTDKGEVWKQAWRLKPRPWTVEVAGLCHRPATFSVDELLRLMPLEERVYRFRCVEAWSMVVPWTGFPLKALLDRVEPTGDARFVRMVSLGDPEQMPGIATQTWYPWPYFEGLTMAEACHELTLLAVGIYGHALPNQHGAPIRLVTPWKYGFKNIKSVVRIELVAERPTTFWNTLVPEEYDFEGNVRPDIPHKRWSQASERVIPSGERVPTRMFNGYEELVAGLYPDLPRSPG